MLSAFYNFSLLIMSVIVTPIKSRAALTAMNKKNVVAYAIDSLEKLNSNLFDPENGVIARLQSQLSVSSRVNSLLSKRLLRLERSNNMNSHYLRKETVELHKFHKEVPENAREEKVLEVFNELKEVYEESYTSADIHAFHGPELPL